MPAKASSLTMEIPKKEKKNNATIDRMSTNEIQHQPVLQPVLARVCACPFNCSGGLLASLLHVALLPLVLLADGESAASAEKTPTSPRTLAAPSVPATTTTAAIETTTVFAVVAVEAGVVGAAVVPTAVVGVVVVAARGPAAARISIGDCPEASTSNAARRWSASRRLYKYQYVSVDSSKVLMIAWVEQVVCARTTMRGGGHESK